jgi:uncharacterized protein
MSPVPSAIYAGAVKHRRLRPKGHRLGYRVFSFLIDIDAIDDLARQCRLFSHNRFNIFSFHDRDYGAATNEPLRTQVEGHLRGAGLTPDGGAIRFLTMPRILGYAFNPLSVYFCYASDGGLVAILYEVNNTFGQRHTYVIPVAANAAGSTLRQECRKSFHVSPFMDMAMSYHFRVVAPGPRVAISIVGRDADGPLINATFAAARRPFDDATLARCFFAYPLLTLKVIAGIHWEALLIWSKGIRPRKCPPPPARPVTFVHLDEA